ncbi:ABC transporter substrate-binding protein [Paenibacillus sp. FSL H8-0548]|uniref:ABC transporter substrate-binding protein n=1 Tax=Paenibacillus sp. FSL H8-0548 TaxID=1920422 RepID=UPI00096C2B74|nr:ABC transporter substrate-binding protein [Paenibacillus sp. FSL H8-0548]OMF18870.1 ABC transporter substrate-binding protein [Paenibacillus sp. FSL H8-0548]
MKRITRWGKTLFVLGMGMSLVLAGCSTSNQNEAKSTNTSTSTDTKTKTPELEPYEMVVVMPGTGDPKDFKEIEAEINKITKEKINTTVKFVPINFGAWAQQTTLMLSGNEKVDVIISGLGTYSQQVAKGQLLPIDDYIDEYALGARKVLDDMDPLFMDAAKINGKTYGIPSVHDLAADAGFTIRKDLVDKYNIDLSAIKTLDDLDAVFKIIKENEPDMIPTTKYGNTMFDAFLLGSIDNLGDGFGVLLNDDNGLKVVNWFETPEYEQLLNTVRRWYLAGYIDKDIATSTDTAQNIVKSGKAASWLQHMKPGTEQQESRNSAKEMVSVHMKPAIATTSKIQTWLWSVPNNAKNPERSMMFINLLFTDKDIVNLYDWGIEGKHYVKTSTDNVIDYPAGVDAANTGYPPGLGFMFGNQFLSYVWKGDDPELWTTMGNFNKEAIKSKALGFTFNAESVKTEIAAVTNVANQFKIALETGTIDPAKNLPEFNKQLKAAGIEKIIAEKQKQLDEWAKQ